MWVLFYSCGEEIPDNRARNNNHYKVRKIINLKQQIILHTLAKAELVSVSKYRTPISERSENVRI